MARNEKQNRRPARETRAPAYIAWHGPTRTAKV
jgi:hypothetical protein